MEQLQQKKHLDDTLSTASLFGKMRGKMFGVMTCLAADGSTLTLKAFSGQFEGSWLAAGWVPPLFDVGTWDRINTPMEQAIKDLSLEIAAGPKDTTVSLRLERRRMSRLLMRRLHALYRLRNFTGRTVVFADIFPEGHGIPTGTGDCCAPKLFNHAATHGLIPLTLCEFYWGRANRSETRRHGTFYPPCTEKCGPLMGAMLCGLEELYEQRSL